MIVSLLLWFSARILPFFENLLDILKFRKFHWECIGVAEDCLGDSKGQRDERKNSWNWVIDKFYDFINHLLRIINSYVNLLLWKQNQVAIDLVLFTKIIWLICHISLTVSWRTFRRILFNNFHKNFFSFFQFFSPELSFLYFIYFAFFS